MTDKFSAIMQTNLQERGIHLPGLPACASLDTQRNRFAANGYSRVSACTMQDLYTKHFDAAEISKIEKLELLDERELLTQLLEHYCLVLAVKSDSNVFSSLAF